MMQSNEFEFVLKKHQKKKKRINFNFSCFLKVKNIKMPQLSNVFDLFNNTFKFSSHGWKIQKLMFKQRNLMIQTVF